MEVIPVIDIRGGKAVAGKSGLREEYKELKTVFANSPDPVKIARNIPSKRIYVADLDGVTKGKPDLRLIKKLSREKKLMVDVGIKDYEDFKKISALDVEVIIGTETLNDVETLVRIFIDSKNVIVSVDIKDGKVISNFLPENPYAAFLFLSKIGVRRFIFLDISSVGTLGGVKYDFLDKVVGGQFEIYIGGGIKKEDLGKLEKIGVSGALVGTALHRGLIIL